MTYKGKLEYIIKNRCCVDLDCYDCPLHIPNEDTSLCSKMQMTLVSGKLWHEWMYSQAVKMWEEEGYPKEDLVEMLL